MTTTASSRGFLRSLLSKPMSAASLIVLAIIVIATVFAGVLAPYEPDAQDLTAALQGPSSAHWLGTGELGRDVLSRMMYGGRVTLIAALIAGATFILAGVPAGMLAGYRGGRFDQVVLKTADLVFAVPVMIVLLVVLAIFPGNEFAAMAVFGLLGAPGLARVVRSATLGIRNELYVKAAVASGIRDRVIVLRHVLPRVSGTILVQASVFTAGAVLMETGLGFLGLGTQNASWGSLVAEASRNLGIHPWLLIPSGAIIITFIMSVNLLADGVRDTLAERYTPPAAKVRAPRGGAKANAGASATAEATPVAGGADNAGAARASAAADPHALLSVRSLTVTLPIDGVPTDIIRDVSFDIQPGEAMGLVGESGSGKTMTALSILGLLPAGGRITSGSVTVEGTDVATMNKAALRRLRGGRIGWISQDPISSLDPSFTVGWQVAEAVRSHRPMSRRAAWQHALTLLEKVKLPDVERVAKSYPHQLSGGMAQRVGIAAALAADPVLVIADEPTTALDVTVQADILALLRDLQADGLGVLLITHNWGVLADLCDRAAVMYAGQVVETADLRALVHGPEHPYTAALLACDPHQARPGAPLPALDGAVPPPPQWPQGCHFQSRCPFVKDDCRTGAIALADGSDSSRAVRCHHPLTRQEVTL
ncbi:dipeptide/oligopeptide/nickel ABC transporter permease/ATP-binding protein [Demequina sp. NBRC 110051]|uniref:dipeptide/oligopeptide/nickel ABC transporter permease/ATP-binding protein n=1 Tax=Demequina sp. NBRC 110051 TaxID=1570340 RepID=UPI000A0479AC|nr:dipeptide/oligopeptide/nickel ABC transporter permease/ATP-binding protein [Demequina sp. NBRC 110051]